MINKFNGLWFNLPLWQGRSVALFLCLFVNFPLQTTGASCFIMVAAPASQFVRLPGPGETRPGYGSPAWGCGHKGRSGGDGFRVSDGYKLFDPGVI